MNIFFRNKNTHHRRAQAMVEFAIVAPILFLLLFGIFEVGRMVFLYSAVTNASREAVRFGSAIGYDDDNELKYRHCSKIRQVARVASYFSTIPDSSITISYDHGPGTSVFNTCPPGTDVAPGYFVTSGDRIIVTVTGQYTPFTNLIPWGSRSFSATSARTILGYVAVAPGSGGGPSGPGGPTATPTETMNPYNPWTDTPTATEGPSPTPTDTPTPTNTPAAVYTFTPTSTPTSTSTNAPVSTSTPTNTPTMTPTATNTPTATPTYTPTSTSTPALSCSSIFADPISMSNGSKQISMVITNPFTAVTVSTVQVTWNATSGGGAASGKNPPTPMKLTGATLGVSFWPSTVGATDSSGNLTITPTTTVTIPGNNQKSTIIFTFDTQYKNPLPNGTSITIKLSTAGCENVVISQTK